MLADAVSQNSSGVGRLAGLLVDAAGRAPGKQRREFRLDLQHLGLPSQLLTQPWTDATLRVDIGYDSTVWDLDQLQNAVERKLRELPLEVFRLKIADDA